MYAPLAIFVYNRPQHTQKTIEALLKNDLSKETDCYIFADGPKNFDGDQEKTQNIKNSVEEVRSYIRTIKGFKSLTIEISDENKGLANSIIHGVTKIVTQHDRIIVVEDDLVTAPEFLSYMNQSLDLYQNEKNVGAITGYMYPVGKKLPQTVFLKAVDCWGWATWRDRWQLFNPDGKQLLHDLGMSRRCNEFDLDGAYPFTQMLRDQIAGLNNSWAIRWYASLFLKNYLCLCPGASLVSNIGFDNSGTHCGNMTTYNIENFSIFSLPLEKIEVIEDIYARMILRNFFIKIQKPLKGNFPKRLIKLIIPKKILEILKKILKK